MFSNKWVCFKNVVCKQEIERRIFKKVITTCSCLAGQLEKKIRSLSKRCHLAQNRKKYLTSNRINLSAYNFQATQCISKLILKADTRNWVELCELNDHNFLCQT